MFRLVGWPSSEPDEREIFKWNLLISFSFLNNLYRIDVGLFQLFLPYCTGISYQSVVSAACVINTLLREFLITSYAKLSTAKGQTETFLTKKKSTFCNVPKGYLDTWLISQLFPCISKAALAAAVEPKSFWQTVANGNKQTHSFNPSKYQAKYLAWVLLQFVYPLVSSAQELFFIFGSYSSSSCVFNLRGSTFV